VLRGEHTLAGVSRYLRRIATTGRTPRVVVLCGAGMSTSAGIKDFRSSTGVYVERGMSRAFTADFFESNPKEFYEAALSAFGPISALANVHPTPAHALLRVLRDAGWLLRVYTQNIDHLERKVGLQPEEIVECHGSLFRTVCRACNTRNETPNHVAQFWRAIEDKNQPVCSCGGVLRPDIVLFGEPLPARFHQLAYADVAACDLLLVLGTSLVVYPVASLPSFVGQLAPRVLINREPSGCFQNVPPCNIPSSATDLAQSTPSPAAASGPGLSASQQSATTSGGSTESAEGSVTDGARGISAHYRDVFYQGGCDEGAIELAESLGLGTALAAVIAR
jgi:NAD+-dependent protein deacetylase sirtuin 2